MSDIAVSELLLPSTLAHIDNYSFLARVVVEGYISGLHRSLYHGLGSEFFQYRNYSQGDDLKYVDWKLFARSEKIYSKVFLEDTNMNCSILLDTSSSMSYCSSGSSVSKQRYGCMLAATIAYLASRQGDNVGLFIYNDDLLRVVEPKRHNGGLRRIMLELARVKSEGIANQEKVFSKVLSLLKRRGVLVIISDFLDDAGVLLDKWLKYFRSAKQDCIILQVLDRDELEFGFKDSVEFVGLETGNHLLTAPELIADNYRKSMQEYCNTIRTVCLQEQVDFVQLRTDESLGSSLLAYLHKREKMH